MGIKVVMVHGAMWYECESCGARWRMWLEVGVEDKNKKQPCPFVIGCYECSGEAKHVDWNDDIHLPEPRPMTFSSRYFALDNSGSDMACGIPREHIVDTNKMVGG